MRRARRSTNLEPLCIIKEVDGKAGEGDKREAWPPFNWYAFTQVTSWNLETGNAIAENRQIICHRYKSSDAIVPPNALM